MSRLELAFEAILNGEHDEICIPCENKKAQESVRSQANAVKRKRKSEVEKEIYGIGKLEVAGKLYIRIYRKSSTELLVPGKNGELVPFVKMEGINLSEESTDEERVEILKRYSKSERAIKEYLEKWKREKEELKSVPVFAEPPEEYFTPEKTAEEKVDFASLLVNPEEWESTDGATSESSEETRWSEREIGVRSKEKEEMLKALKGE